MRYRLLVAAGVMWTAMAVGSAHADQLFDRCEKAALKTMDRDSDLAPCGGAWLARAEARLKDAWKKASDALGEDYGQESDQGKALREEERAWVFFKDKACRRYDLMSAGTLGRFHDANVCRAQIIEDRINELTGDLQGRSLS